MKKSLVISEQDSIAGVLENDRVVEFFVNRGELLLGDIYSATVENILPGIDAAFVNLGKDKMGFLHANDVPGQGPLKERLVPKQKLLVQITKEPTGHKGPRVSTAISLPGRFLVLVPEERGVSISRRISEARERARLKSVVNLMKPPGIGLIIRTEAKGQGEGELFDDFEQLWDRWQTVVSEGEASIGPTLIYRDQDLLFRVIRDAYSHDVSEIICDTADGQKRAQEYLQGWAGKQTRVTFHTGDDSLLVAKGIDREIEAALSDRVELPSGGHLNIQPTEALTVIDVNSGRFTSSRTQAETVRRTNLEAAQEIPRQLRLRNIGGMVIVDFIDMDSRKDQQQVLEVFQRVLEEDRAKPQIGQLSDLGLVELTRRRQGQSLRELFTAHCTSCAGMGVIPTLELGTADNRRVISFKSREEELAKGRGKRSNRSSGGVLRAATASNGRVMPTIEEPEEEDALAYVPEDILAQMPDDLLSGPDKVAGGGNKFANYAPSGEEDDDSEEEVVESVTFRGGQREDFAPKSRLFEESFEEEEESPMAKNLSQNISAVEQVYQDMGSRNRPVEAAEVVDEEEVEIEDVVVISSNPLEEAASIVLEEPAAAEHEHDDDDHDHEHGAEHTGHSEHAQHVGHAEEHAEHEEVPVSYEAASPYETEYDPVTGVYRLKVKTPVSDDEQTHAEAHSGQTFEEQHHHVSHETHQGGTSEFEQESRIQHTNEMESVANAPAPQTHNWNAEQLTIPVYETQRENETQNGEDSTAGGAAAEHETGNLHQQHTQAHDQASAGEESETSEENKQHEPSAYNF
jgi:Rne/Rng family ribonuclease